MFKLRNLVTVSGVALLIAASAAKADPASEIAAAVGGGEVVDLTVTISENYPAHWPFHPPFRRCLLYTSPSPRDKRQSRMPSSA